MQWRKNRACYQTGWDNERRLVWLVWAERRRKCFEDMSGPGHGEPWRTHQCVLPCHESNGSTSWGFKLENEISGSQFEKLTRVGVWKQIEGQWWVWAGWVRRLEQWFRSDKIVVWSRVVVETTEGRICKLGKQSMGLVKKGVWCQDWLLGFSWAQPDGVSTLL